MFGPLSVIFSEYPGYSFMRPREFRERFLNKTLDSFDVIFTYSSLEHSGQGIMLECIRLDAIRPCVKNEHP